MSKWILFLGIVFSFGVEASPSKLKVIIDPMTYSEQQSKLFSEGDSNDSSGWESCWYDESENESVTHIRCRGDRSILVHGGVFVTRPFTCHYVFSPTISGPEGYYIEAGECR